MSNEVVTRKDEVRYKTSDVTRIKGKWLASAAVKKWKEDFIDESTGEVIKVDRSEILIGRGKYIDDDTQTKINFYLQCGDLTEVEVTNQHRLAHVNTRYALYPFKVTANIDGKKHNFILQASNAVKAVEVATDYIELNCSGGFDITAVKWLENVVIMNEPIRPASEIEAEQASKGDGATDEDQTQTEKYYKIEANLVTKSEDDEDPEQMIYVFIVKTKDVDTAKVVLSAWIDAKVAQRAAASNSDVEVVELSILAASPFSCNAIIGKEFCLAYKESDPNEEIKVEDRNKLSK